MVKKRNPKSCFLRIGIQRLPQIDVPAQQQCCNAVCPCIKDDILLRLQNIPRHANHIKQHGYHHQIIKEKTIGPSQKHAGSQSMDASGKIYDGNPCKIIPAAVHRIQHKKLCGRGCKADACQNLAAQQGPNPCQRQMHSAHKCRHKPELVPACYPCFSYYN